MTEAVVKGELHVSRADLKEAKGILEEGVDCLVLEYPENESEFHLRYVWFHVLMWCLTHFFFNRLYTDPTPLEYEARSQGSNVKRTRGSDIEIIENASLFEEFTGLFAFIVLIPASLYLGLLPRGMESFTVGAGIFILGAILPPLYLRSQESERTELNRDEAIADTIVEASEGAERVVAVVGAWHLNDVVSHLPDWIEPDPRKPVYEWYHPWGLLHLARALIVVLSLYGGLYVMIIAVLRIGIFMFG